MYHGDICHGMPKWKPAKATETIREYASSDKLSLLLTHHARQRLAERDLQIGDILHLLKYGHIYQDPTPATQPSLFKYELEGTTPNSHTRFLKAIVIPHPDEPQVKVVSIMWKDEKA